MADDPSQLPGITYDSKLATARMAQQLPDSNPVTARLRKIITDAVLEGNDAQADRIIAEAVRNAQLTPQQIEVIDQWRDAVESQRGVDDSIIQQTENFEEEQRQQIETIAASDGTVTQLQMKDGSTAYLKSGELANRYGGVMVSDETGKTRQEPVSAVQAIVSTRSVDDILAERVNDYAATLQAQYAGMSDGSVLTPGQQVDMVLSGQPVAAVVAGTDAQGNVIFQLEDGSQMPLYPADAQQAIATADDVKIQAQLKVEAEATVAQQQTQRFAQGIKGYAEGQPDLSAADTDAKTAADYILSQLGADGSDPEKGRKQQLKDIQATKDQMKIRQEEAQSELTRQQQWLDGNEDIADPAEIEHVKQRITMLTDAIADLQQRQQKWSDIRMNLMNREEQNQLEQERRREIFKARSGYQPTLPQRNLTTNEDRITLEDGQPNFGLTPVGNANNYLLRNYQESTDAEKFVNAQRLALRNKQRDEVQPEINRRNDMLNAYASGRIELTPDEVTQLTHEVADLENYQDTLSKEAVNLRNIAEGIPALYERNNRNQELTPAEQRGKALDKAGSRDDKIRIARNIYKVSPEALDVINDQEPKTIEEFISDNLPYGKLNWEGFDRGERHINGVQEAVFGKNGATRGIGKGYSTNAFNTYLAPEGQGMGFDEMVHYLYESSPEVDGRKLYDDTQIRDALINMLLTAQKPTDISHLMIDNRIAEAEDIIRRQEEYDREMEEEAKYQELQEWADAYHLNPDEVESYQDYLNEKPWEFDEEVINQIIADDESKQDQFGKKMDRQHPDRPAGSEGEGGEGQVLNAGTEEGAGENTPVAGQPGAEGGAGISPVPDTDVSGGTSDKAIEDGTKGEDLMHVPFAKRLKAAKAETDTNPTEAQKEAGNYKMGHIRFGGYRMSIENPKGSTRSGVDKNKQPWSIEMQDTYGYIGKKYGTDGDHLDFFINDDADLDTFDGRVYVVDQKNEDGTFDEHKVMYGYPTWSAARKAYERNYEPGWWDKHVMQMTGVKKADFDKWLADSDHKTKPFADYYRTRMAETVNDPADQMLADVKDREEAAASRTAELEQKERILQSLNDEPTTGENAVQQLSDAYSLGDKDIIRDLVNRVRDIVKKDENILMDSEIDPDWLEEYDGDNPLLRAQKYIVRLARHYFVDYDDDIPYIVTGIESPKDRPAVPESIRYDVEAFLANDYKLGQGQLHGKELHDTMHQQNELAAKIQPLLKKLSDEQLDQTVKALKDFEDSTPVIAVQMEQEARAEKKDAVKERDDIMFQIDQPMAGEKGVKSLMEGNLFSDADFLPQPTKKEKEISELNDEDLLDNISKTDGKVRRQFIDEYDKRHDAERKEETNAYYDMLESSNTTKDQALEMYNSAYRQFMKDGYATADRTKLMGQMDALEDYIQSLDEAEAERDMEEQEEAAVTQQQTQPEPTEAEQKYEEQKKEVQKLGYDLTQMRLRPLEEGETCHVERRYVENNMFCFTGKERIESLDDVAYIFRQLEDAAVENTFLVLQKDGVPTIIHLATGGYTQSYAPHDQALAAYQELNPEKVYFIHNHPSGNLKCSKPDMNLMSTLRSVFGKKLQDGIIIDTKSGKYGVFSEMGDYGKGHIPTGQEDAVPMKVYSFGKQVFDEDWDPETAFDGSSPMRIASFVSSHRLGDHKKMSLIVMTQNWKVTGNVFLPWTDLKQATTPKGIDLIAKYANQMAGTIVLLYGNYDFDYSDKEKRLIKKLQNEMKKRYLYLSDVIHINHSARDARLVGEPEPAESKAGEAKVVGMKHVNIEDDYSNSPTIDESLNMGDRVKAMRPNDLITNYKRLDAEMRIDGLNVDDWEERERRKYIAEHGIDKGYGKAMADRTMKLADMFTWKKLSLRWDILDRIEELGLQDYLNTDELPEKGTKIVKMYRQTTPEIEKANARFNQELDRQINDPTFPKDYIYKLGKPGVVLLSTGFPNDDIEMSASHLLEKSRKTQHPFKLEDVKNLVKAINNPIAVFSYGDENKAQNVIVELERDGKKFMVGIHFKQGHRGSVVSDIRGIFPRDNSDWINWINKGKGLYLDKNKIQNLIAQQRKILAEVSHLDLNSVAKIIKDFPNPKLSEENLRNIYGNFVETAEETADLLGGTKVVFESESTEKGTLGWYDPNDNSVHIVLPEHTNADDIKRTVFHEKLGHEGLVALLGSQEEVDKFGQFVFGSASKDIRNRIIEKANENDPGWKDHLRFSHAAQEVIADIAENGPRTADEFSLWRKIKHYLIRLLNKLGLKVRGLLNDHDLAYYILKTGEALKKWNQMSDPDKEAAARQYDIMRSRRGKPRKRNNESMAQYLQRLRDWEMWKIAEEQAAANNDPMPEADKINEKWHEQFNRDMDEWRRNNNIPEGESLGEFPKRRQNETPQEYAARVADYETEADAWKNAPSLFDYLQRANEEYRQAYADWKMRYGIREAENVDLGLYEGDPDRLPHIVNPEDLEADNRAEADLAEAVGVDMSPEGARRHTKLSVIERRKNLESANAEDAIWIHNMVNSINMEANRQGVEPKMLREALADIIEGTYFEEVLKDDEGNVIAINDISDQLPIKMTTGLKDILAAIKDWYDYFYHEIEDAGLRNDAGYVEEGYVNHVWSREKSNPEAWKKYIDNFQRTKSPNMRERIFETYREGEDIGLVRKYKDIADILAHYSSSNNQAIANKKFLDDLSFIVVEELNGDGEVVSVLPLLNSQKPNIAVSDRYSMYQVPGIGDVYVLKDVQRTFANIFGTMRTTDVPEWLTKTGKFYDVASSTAKKIQLSFSAFHMGALTEVAMAQMRPDRAMKALAQYIIFDCAKKGTIPAYAHPEDFKFAASHLVQLGATQDYSAADVNNVTEKIREMVRELANSEQMAKKGAGFAATPVAAALDYINKGLDKVLWNYLHDGLKIACFKMFAEQIEKRVEKEGLTPEKREELLDEAGQYV